MMRWLIDTSLRLQLLVVTLAVILLISGIAQLRNFPVDVFPEFDPPFVEIQTEALGLSAAEMEALITVPLEADLLNGVAWLDQIYSESVTGLSSILLIFEPGTDPIRARQMVQERLTQTFALPNVSKPPTMIQPLSSASRVGVVGLSSNELSLIDLSVLARWNIRPRLMGVPGVANVAIWGQREKQLQIQVDPRQLREKRTTLAQVIRTAGEALWVSPLSYLESSTPGTAGWIDTPNQRLSIRHQLPITTPADLAQVPLVGTSGLLLGDVADVVEDHQPLIGDAMLKDGPGLLLVIEKFPGANTLEATRGVEAALEAMRPGLRGVTIDTTIFRPASYLERAIANLTAILAIGGGFLLLLLVILLGGWRPALVSVGAILLSLLTAVYILKLRDTTLSAIVLMGLGVGLGVIIDDAVVDSEQVFRRFRERSAKRQDATNAKRILAAVLEMRRPMAFATIILLLFGLPLFSIEGLTGIFFRPLAAAYLLSVLAAFAISLLVTPALSATLVEKTPRKPKAFAFTNPLQASYRRILASQRSTRFAIPIIVFLIVVSVASLPFLKFSRLPSFKQTDILIEWEAVPGTSRQEMTRVIDRVSQELRSISGVRSVGAHVGRAVTGDAVVGINSAELWVNLDPQADYDTAIAAIRATIDGYPGVFREAQNYQPERLGEALLEKGEDLGIRIYGYDLEVLRALAEEISKAVSGIRGVVAVQPDFLVEEPQVEIEVDLAAGQRYQVKPGDVRRAAATLLSGLQVGNLYEQQKVFDVVVWGKPAIRGSLTDIRELSIETPRGQVPLDALADIRIRPAPLVIRRDAVSRFIDVEVDVAGRSLGAVTADIERALRDITFPLEYHAEVIGSNGIVRPNPRWIAILLATALGTYLILQATLASWRLAGLSLVVLPLTLTGGVLAVLLDGGNLSLGSLFGFLAVLGIAVRQSLLLLSRIQQFQQEMSAPDAVLRGAQERAVPILTTSAAIAAVTLPLVTVGEIAGTELLRPLAVVILGGTISTTLVSLYLLPALYLRLNPKEPQRR